MVRALKRFGQHFLEPAWVRKVVDAIDPRTGDVFVEVGPGTGALTFALAERGAPILAVEIDRALAARLRERAPAHVRVIEADVLRVDLAAVAREAAASVPPRGGSDPDDPTAARSPATASPGQSLIDDVAGGGLPRVRVVGNLPYNVASPVLLRVLYASRRHDIVDATFMLQQEVAHRVVASPGGGDYGPLSIAVQLHADASQLFGLPPGAFRPPPKVRSALVRLAFRPPRVPLGDERLFDALVRGVFTQRRKTLGNALAGFASARGRRADDALAAAGIDGTRRPQTLSLEEFAALAAVFGNPEAHPPRPPSPVPVP